MCMFVCLCVCSAYNSQFNHFEQQQPAEHNAAHFYPKAYTQLPFYTPPRCLPLFAVNFSCNRLQQ